jgi:hypothetical protein
VPQVSWGAARSGRSASHDGHAPRVPVRAGADARAGRLWGGDGPGSPTGEYPGDPDLGPREVVRAYVRALDERDGQRFCELVAPYISGRYDLVTRDPDGIFRHIEGCPEFVSAYIGYVEDCCVPEFLRAKVERIGAVETHGELRRVRARVRVQLLESAVPRTERVDEVVWLARFDGAWRVAKLDEVADLASIGGPEVSASTPPDIAREMRSFAARIDAAERTNAEHEASYQALGEAADCSGGASVRDAEGDQIWNGAATKSGDPSRVPGGDLLGVDVGVDGQTVCARWRLAGTPEPPMALSYGHRMGPTAGAGFDQFFEIEIREDGNARVASGEDDDGRPIAVPAEVGADGSSVSLRLDAESFGAGQATWQRPTEPPLERFGFSAGTVAKAGKSSSVLDNLGSAPSDTFRYSDGRLCDFEGC